ncbi:hypothetical protein TVAG_332410 [Trichomonas vaginalis G3]|uniref:DUF3447 domain-containing protein n=1 Tax=Trichomonas vaginalis (strain ATCC PRA-98 / G3) TaxID=412133 RepID=A2FAB4_TRIV3|nr:proteasome regulatory particle assembly [Trichomonas vaginalis G3]EAX98131.1 hypothetical protein TVAG_332410 [Trichomonas vaginalis G3]KAI5484847.1 proteasome regulatory particle assembly [Trichomonas vaginalis G3]|eukprot:XP_001311061.1 hypothetical protein [Trichomonas vaginalis G3]
MSTDYATPYLDFIKAFEKLFIIKSNESVEDMCNIITNVLILKYQLTKKQLAQIIIKALQYNYASCDNYAKILKNIGMEINDLSDLRFPSEDSIEFTVMHDHIDKFKDYISQNKIKDKFFKIPILNNIQIKSDRINLSYYYRGKQENLNLSLIETCAYFGSVNIFFFLISNQKYTISKECLRYSLIGRNTDIINECLKKYLMDKDCLRDIVCSHNNSMLEFGLERNFFTYNDFERDYVTRTAIYQDIIKYQNLKAVFLLYENAKDLILPWCAAFPQTIDIIKNEKITDKTDLENRNILHYACMSPNSDIVKFLFNSTIKIDVNHHDMYSMTALHYAAMNNNLDAVKILISHGVEVNNELSRNKINHSNIKFSLI